MSDHSEPTNESPLPIATDSGKLIPEWKVDADDQVILAGVLVFLLLLGGLGISSLTGDDTDDSAVSIEAVLDDDDDDDDALLVPPIVDSTVEEEAPQTTTPEEPPVEEAAPETTTPPATESPATTPVDLEPAVVASVASLARVNGSIDGTTAVLTGFVDNAAASASAEIGAAAVEGITDVDNQLVVIAPTLNRALSTVRGANVALTDGAVILTGFVDDDDESTAAAEAAEGVDGVLSVDNDLIPIQPGAVAALEAAGVTGAVAVVDNLDVTARGELAEEADRQGALDAVAAVAGVASVTDELTVAAPDAAPDVSESLNALVELEPVQFATSSPVVLESSFPTLDRAAEIILGADVSGTIEVQGYTDIRGNEASNLSLSDGRAAAVVEYLVNAGVAPEQLTSVGFGGTTQFGEGDSDEAFAANRRVVFVLQDAG